MVTVTVQNIEKYQLGFNDDSGPKLSALNEIPFQVGCISTCGAFKESPFQIPSDPLSFSAKQAFQQQTEFLNRVIATSEEKQLTYWQIFVATLERIWQLSVVPHYTAFRSGSSQTASYRACVEKIAQFCFLPFAVFRAVAASVVLVVRCAGSGFNWLYNECDEWCKKSRLSYKIAGWAGKFLLFPFKQCLNRLGNILQYTMNLIEGIAKLLFGTLKGILSGSLEEITQAIRTGVKVIALNIARLAPEAFLLSLYFFNPAVGSMFDLVAGLEFIARIGIAGTVLGKFLGLSIVATAAQYCGFGVNSVVTGYEEQVAKRRELLHRTTSPNKIARGAERVAVGHEKTLSTSLEQKQVSANSTTPLISEGMVSSSVSDLGVDISQTHLLPTDVQPSDSTQNNRVEPSSSALHADAISSMGLFSGTLPSSNSSSAPVVQSNSSQFFTNMNPPESQTPSADAETSTSATPNTEPTPVAPITLFASKTATVTTKPQPPVVDLLHPPAAATALTG